MIYKMKIYYASQSFYPHIGGVSTYLLNLAGEIVKRGHEVVEVHLRPSGESGRDEIDGIDVRRVPKEPIDNKIMQGYSKFKDSVYIESHYHKKEFTKPVSEMEGFAEFNVVNEYFGAEIKNLLDKEPADIVHIHDFQLLFSYKYVPRGTSLVFTWHIPFMEGMSDYLSDFLVKNLNEYDKVVFSSQEYIDAAVKAGLAKEKVELIYPICNTDMFKVREVDKEEIRKKYGIPKDAKVILCVQRVDPKSGHDQLIRALPLILKKIKNAKLVFVGGKSLSNKLSNERELLEKEIKSLIKKLDLERDIIWTGNIDYHVLPELYNSVDLVALCSKNEGFGLSVTEGMACGNPVVGTNVGGIPLQIKDDLNGYLVEVNDHKKTAQAIISILEDDGLRKRMSKSSIDIVEKDFRMEKGIEQHVILYTQLWKKKDEFHKLEYKGINDIKTFVTDLDRTITDKAAKREFDPADFNPRLMKQLKELNKDMFLATGRPFSYVLELSRHFKIWRCIISENGAVIYFPRTEKKITLDTPFMKEARRIINGMDLDGTTVGEVLTSSKISDLERIKKQLGKLSGKLRFVNNVDEVMILPSGVDKGVGLKIAMSYLNLDPEKSIIIGDGENDADMFLNPGFKIALANAHPKLKNLANQVTTESSTRGVLQVIEKLRK